MKFYDEEIIDGKYVKTYKNDEYVRLDEIVNNLHSKSASIKSIEVSEANEMDMREFGEKFVSPEDLSELHRYSTSDDYHYAIKAEYNNQPIDFDIYKSIYSITSEDPDLQLTDIYEDVKKKEIDEMVESNQYDEKDLSNQKKY